MARARHLSDETPGPALAQWIAVTLLLSLAFWALFQVIGPQLGVFFDGIITFAGRLAP
jgi:hypothetical protein